MKEIIITVIIFAFYCLALSGQTYLSEGFESGTRPVGWTQEIVNGNTSWRYQNGGYGPPPPSTTRFPQNAYSGSYNALFQVEQQGPKTKLITKPIDLSAAKKPELIFWHAQDKWGDLTAIDELKLYYKVHADSAWRFLKEYLGHTPLWTKRELFLPDSTLSATYYIAFEGKSNWGWGVCIDDIELVERGLIPMQIRESGIFQASTYLIPTSAINNPILRIELNVYGNTGNMLLDSIAIKSLNQDNNDIVSSGVKLFHTLSESFSSENMIGSPKTFSSEIIWFNNLNYVLPYGKSYIWVTLDVSSSATHGNIVDLSIPMKGIKLKLDTSSISFNQTIYPVGDSIYYLIDDYTHKAPVTILFPATETSPLGDRLIQESIFYDDFETLKGWILSGDFQIQSPLALGGYEGGNPDPAKALSGNNVLGTDLSGLGATFGDYENSNFNVYYAESPIFNCHFYQDIKLSYYRWLNIEAFDNAIISLSIDSGENWVDIYSSSSNISENSWSGYVLNLSEYGANRQTSVKLRFGLRTDLSGRRSGWNIDNFAITGDYISSDVGITDILAPVNGCAHTASDTITVVIKNFAGEPTKSFIPLKYSLNGGTTYLYDTIFSSIPSDDSITITLNKMVDLTVSGIYDLIVSTNVNDDEDISNNLHLKKLYIQPTYRTSHYEDFESSQGLWIVNGNANNTWLWKNPAYPITPLSGNYSWVTSDLFYNNLDSSFVISPCYDFTDGNRNILEFNYWLKSEPENDGMNIQYSVDNGDTWTVLDNNESDWNWVWYTDTVKSLNSLGWSGNISAWSKAYQLLPVSFAGVPWVKFRVAFASDSTNVDRGLAFDDFSIYPAPPDVGVISIDSPVDDCLNEVSDQVTVTVKNFGLNKIRENDTMILGYIFDGNPTVYDTLVLTGDLHPENTMQFSFSERINMTTAKLYQLSVFTLFEDDPWFYGSNNDTLSKSIEAYPLPITDLPDTIQSREPDTVVIRARKDINYDYSWKDKLGAELSTADTLKVPGDGIFYLLVTNSGGNGCSSLDSVYVELLYSDVGIDTIISPVSSCELSENEQITLRIKNFGTDSIFADSKIAVSYIFNGGAAVTDTLVLTRALQAGETKLFTFTGNYEDFSVSGTYSLKLFNYYGGDTVRHNDTLNLNIEVFGYPTVDIGGDKVVEALTYPLDAGPGFVSYLWQDGDSVQVHIVDETGLYHVSVTDIHGCPGYDTAFIRLKIRDVSPYILLNPVSACDIPGNVNVQLQAKNTGNDTIPQNSKIYVKYQMGSKPIRGDSITLTSPLYPGGTANRTFSYVENLNQHGEYIFMLYATTINDLISANDTLYDTVYIQPGPVVDFGLDAIYTHRGLDFVLDAGYGESYNYLWQNGATTQTYSVTSSGVYKVKVTDSRTGCFAKDSVTIYLIITDVGITAVSLTNDSCSGSFDNVQVQIRNHGNTSIAAGEIIHVAYSLNNSLIGEDDFVLTSVFPFGGNILRNLSNTITITDGVQSKLKVYTRYAEDLRPQNDTLTRDYGIAKRSPVVNFNDVAGVLMADLPHVLTPEAGHPAYLWQDNSTSSTYTVTAYGQYSVTVTANNGCKTSKTVNVVFKTGIDERNGNPFNLLVYPNPAENFLNLEMDLTEVDDVTLEFYNSEGRLIFNDRGYKGSEYMQTIDVSSFAGGVYFIRIYNSKLSQINKVIIY